MSIGYYSPGVFLPSDHISESEMQRHREVAYEKAAKESRAIQWAQLPEQGVFSPDSRHLPIKAIWANQSLFADSEGNLYSIGHDAHYLEVSPYGEVTMFDLSPVKNKSSVNLRNSMIILRIIESQGCDEWLKDKLFDFVEGHTKGWPGGKRGWAQACRDFLEANGFQYLESEKAWGFPENWEVPTPAKQQEIADPTLAKQQNSGKLNLIFGGYHDRTICNHQNAISRRSRRYAQIGVGGRHDGCPRKCS